MTISEKFKIFYSGIQNFKKFAFNFLKIKDKQGKIVPFVLNNAQKKILQVYEKLQGEPVRLIILKARQEGVSTLVEGLIFQRNSFDLNRKAVIIGHEQEASNNLFAMFKRFYEYLHDPIKPILEHSNEKKLSYKKLKSEIKVYSAESGEKVGRSSTNQDIHCTEVAFWRNAKESMLALLQTVPDEPNTMVVIESTANGIGGWFYDTWKGAISGENDYTPIFLAWFDLPEYSKKLENGEILAVNTLTDYEREIKRKYNLTLEQLNWRRYTIKNKCNGDEELFKQEYPSTPEEAFLTTGRPVFDINICSKRLFEAKKPLCVGDLVENGGKVEFVENPKGFIKIQETIVLDDDENNVFAAGCDVAEGLDQGDRSIIKVLDRRTNKVCLTWAGHIDPDMLADEQMKIQKFLKEKIYFCTEMNNHGLTTISRGYHLGLNQYYRDTYQKGYGVQKNILGWKTTSQSKPIMINALSEWIRENLFEDSEKEFWSECLTFVRNAKGQMQAEGKDRDPSTKNFDDRVIANALMIICSNWMPNYYRTKEKEQTRLPAEEYELTETTL